MATGQPGAKGKPIHMLKTKVKSVLGGVSVAAVTVTLAPTAPAHAEPGCLQSPWGFLGLTKKRIMCDGPIQPDGSWMRRRAIGVPSHYACPSSSCSSGTCYSPRLSLTWDHCVHRPQDASPWRLLCPDGHP